MNSGIFKIYKNSGAAQFSIKDPTFNEQGYLSREGAVLIQVGKGAGKDKDGNIKIDWDNKIIFAINMADIAKLLDTSDPKAGRLFHEHNGTNKTLELVPGTGQYEGTWKLQVYADKQSIMVPLTNGEYNLIMRLLVAAAPRLIGWWE